MSLCAFASPHQEDNPSSHRYDSRRRFTEGSQRKRTEDQEKIDRQNWVWDMSALSRAAVCGF